MKTPESDTLHSDSNQGAPGGVSRPVRLAYVVSHPIQYQVPLLRRIAAEPDIDLTVFYGSDASIKGYKDSGFGGVEVKWDVPLLGGYKHEFLPPLRDTGTEGTFSPISRSFSSRLMREGKPAFDALWVHGYATTNQMRAILSAKALGIPVLVRAESWLRDRPRSGLKLTAKTLYFRALGKAIDAVLYNGTLNRQYWEHYLGPDFPSFPMPYAVDNDFFQQRSREAAAGQSELRTELGLEPGRPVILFASKLQTRKHCNDLIEAYTHLSPAPGMEPDPYLIIVGDGEERVALERQAEATGLRSIRFCGFRNQSELPRFFDLASVFVLPSRNEAWGLIVNEVMNAARPVIITDDCGCAVDLVTNGVEGYVYPVRDVAALVGALRRVFARPEAAREMGLRALGRINQWGFEQDVAGLKAALAHVTRLHPSPQSASATSIPADGVRG